MSMDLDQSKPFTAEQIKYCHEWSLDYLIAENERRHGQADVHSEGHPVDIQVALDRAEVEDVADPPQPTYVGALGGVQQGPLIVEGETNEGRVPLPRDHPLTQEVVDGEGDGILSGDDDFDEEAAKAEIAELNVDELKAELHEFDEPVSGNKKELQERLLEAYKKDAGAK